MAIRIKKRTVALGAQVRRYSMGAWNENKSVIKANWRNKENASKWCEIENKKRRKNDDKDEVKQCSNDPHEGRKQQPFDRKSNRNGQTCTSKQNEAKKQLKQYSEFSALSGFPQWSIWSIE